MFSLTTRLALLLVVSLIGVVALAAAITTTLVRGPRISGLERSLAERAAIVALAARGSPDAAQRLGVAVGPMPPGSTVDEHLSRHFRRLVRHRGAVSRVEIVTPPDGHGRRIAIPVSPDRYAFLPFPPPPAFPLRNLAFYLSLIAIGVTAVAVYAANRMMRPLRMLESTIATLGPDGIIPHMPETGAPEIRATAQIVNRLTARLNAVTESRMRLVAAAGHDLRTPMTRMRLRTEFIEDEEERAAWLKDIDELDRIADSAIRLVREEVSSDPKEPVALDGLIREIATELGDLGMPVSLKPMDRAEIVAPPFAMKRALRNLIINAATHGGGAEVGLRSDAKGVIIAIEDNGPGIPGALIERVFEPFFRVDEARRQFHPGAGLGFAIAREIITRNGGRLTIENRLSGGLRQTVSFEAAAA